MSSSSSSSGPKATRSRPAEKGVHTMASVRPAQLKPKVSTVSGSRQAKSTERSVSNCFTGSAGKPMESRRSTACTSESFSGSMAVALPVPLRPKKSAKSSVFWRWNCSDATLIATFLRRSSGLGTWIVHQSCSANKLLTSHPSSRRPFSSCGHATSKFSSAKGARASFSPCCVSRSAIFRMLALDTSQITPPRRTRKCASLSRLAAETKARGQNDVREG
mmetsp:Transcript_56790/g.162989  ORF Transcript_56790/g.162989 Transcript_56790/m.162989 type:complete len:219 (+) Transcript_56790:799-1455(+)